VITSDAVLAVAVLAGSGLAVEHEPLTCVRIDTYPRVEARGVPAADVAAAELQFRTGETGWYRTPMARTTDGWAALLPRPSGARDAFEYRVAFTSTQAGEPVSTPSVLVPVTSTCAASAVPAVPATIVVTVPEGAPVVPPVPAGFSPAGVAGAEVAAGGSSKTPLVIAGTGVVATAAIAGAVASTGGGPAPLPEVDVPTLRFNVTVPPPGSTVSVSSGTLSVFMLLDHVPTRSPVFDWRAEFLRGPIPAPCVSMSGRFGFIDTLGIILTAPLVPAAGCTLPVDTTLLRMVFEVDGATVHLSTTEVPFRFEP
jgi:hypothetical protein